MNRMGLAGALGLGMALSACGSSAGGASCAQSNGQFCTNYVGSFYTQERVSALCTSPNTYSTSRCTTTGQLGKCVVSSGASTETQYIYYTSTIGTTLPVSLTSHCSTLSGTYTAGS